MKIRNCVAVALLALATTGCTTLSESQLDAREYRQVDFQEQFKAYRMQCLAAGKRVYIDAQQRIARNGLPRPGDRYFCA